MINQLENLMQVIKSRKDAPSDESYVASLYAKGRKKIAQKVGEEGVELSLAAVLDDKKEAVSESADLLFHMMVLWSDMGIEIPDIIKELERRERLSGLDEKNNRPK